MFSKKEAGQTLIIALILLAVGSLLVVPVLSHVFTNLNYNQTIECKTLNDYSADAGIQYATCKIYNDPGTYTSTPLSANFIVNDRTVDVNASYQGGGLFSINSTAYGGGCGKTTVTSYVNLSVGAFAYALASKTSLSIKNSFIDSYPTSGGGHIYANGDISPINNSQIWGDAYAVGTIASHEMIYGDVYERADALEFPSVYAELYAQMAMEGGIYYGNWGFTGTRELGPLYITGDLLVKPGADITLTGPVYVCGNIKGSGGYMHGKEHILCEGDIDMSGGGYGSESIPVLVAITGDITLVGAVVDAVVYAPMGTVDTVNLGTLYGAVGGYSVDVSNTVILYAESLHGRTDLPGSELFPLTYTYD